MTNFRTPLSRVRGHGSARAGTGHFIGERVTSVALALLSPWFVISVALSMQAGFAGAQAWVGQPWNAVLCLLFVVISFHHMQLGMTVIVEDYIHRPAGKALLLLANAFLCWTGAAAAAFAILKIALGA